MTTTSAQTQTTIAQPKKVTVEPINCSNSILKDPFLNKNTKTDTTHLCSDFMPHATHDQFQKHLDELDCDLSKFDLPIEDSINQQNPPITKSSPNQIVPFPNFSNPKILSHSPSLSPSSTISPIHSYHVPEPTLPTLNTPTSEKSTIFPTEKPNLTDTTINPLPQPTWKRIPKADSKFTSGKTEVLGQKRAATHSFHQTKLPNKKHVVSQVNMDNTEIFAKAGS